MRDEMAPMQEKFEAEGKPSPEIWKKLGQQGLLGVSIPAEVGGIGGSFKVRYASFKVICTFCKSSFLYRSV